MQKDMMLDETDKIQNFQQQEINKLKNLLLFREQVNFWVVVRWHKIIKYQILYAGVIGSIEQVKDRWRPNWDIKSRNISHKKFGAHVREAKGNFTSYLLMLTRVSQIYFLCV
jgi:hypothetical protein